MALLYSKFKIFSFIPPPNCYPPQISNILEMLAISNYCYPLISDFNPFLPNAPFLYPLKTSENLTIF